MGASFGFSPCLPRPASDILGLAAAARDLGALHADPASGDDVTRRAVTFSVEQHQERGGPPSAASSRHQRSLAPLRAFRFPNVAAVSATATGYC